jgi:hypothetical protein
MRRPSRRVSPRKRKTRDFLQPKLKEKAYSALPHSQKTKGAGYVDLPRETKGDDAGSYTKPITSPCKNRPRRYKAFWMGQRLRRNIRVWDLCTPLSKTNARALVAAPLSRPLNTSATGMRTYTSPKSVMRLYPNHVCHQSTLPDH